jgi:Erv1 / Alr family
MQELVSDQSIDISFHAISCVPNKGLCRQQNVPGYPVVQLFRPGETSPVTTLLHSDVKPVTMLRHLGINVGGMTDEEVAIEEEPTAENNKAERVGGGVTKYQRARDDLKNDIHLSLDFAMRNNVYIRDGSKALSDPEKVALKAFLKLLKQTLPSSWKELHQLLESLIRNIRYACKKEPYLINLLNQHPPKNLDQNGDPEWSLSCSKGEAGRGFTCGLWEAFHTITVGVVQFNNNQVSDAQLIAPETAARTIRDFVQYFLHCTECVQNFLQMYDNCEYQRCNRLTKTTKLSGDIKAELEWRALSLWLYEAHNGVNVRLLKEKALREKQSTITIQELLDVQYPAVEDCPVCWSVPDRKGKRSWNETAVFSFLKMEYGTRDDTITEFQKQLKSFREKDSTKSKSLRETGQHNRAAVLTSSLAHPCILLFCILGYFSLGGASRAFLTRMLLFGRRKLRTQ